MLNDPIVKLEACRLCELSDSRQKAIFPDISANLVDRAFIAKMTVRRVGCASTPRGNGKCCHAGRLCGPAIGAVARPQHCNLFKGYAEKLTPKGDTDGGPWQFQANG